MWVPGYDENDNTSETWSVTMEELQTWDVIEQQFRRIRDGGNPEELMSIQDFFIWDKVQKEVICADLEDDHDSDLT